MIDYLKTKIQRQLTIRSLKKSTNDLCKMLDDGSEKAKETIRFIKAVDCKEHRNTKI